MGLQLTQREQELIVLGFKCAESTPKVSHILIVSTRFLRVHGLNELHDI
jgi:hypothetical protein